MAGGDHGRWGIMKGGVLWRWGIMGVVYCGGMGIIGWGIVWLADPK